MKKRSEFERLEATWNKFERTVSTQKNSMNGNSCVKIFILEINTWNFVSKTKTSFLQ